MKQRNLPVQVNSMITALLDKNDNVYVRANYRTRLIDIRDAVNEALTKFDNEYDRTFLEKDKG